MRSRVSRTVGESCCDADMGDPQGGDLASLSSPGAAPGVSGMEILDYHCPGWRYPWRRGSRMSIPGSGCGRRDWGGALERASLLTGSSNLESSMKTHRLHVVIPEDHQIALK